MNQHRELVELVNPPQDVWVKVWELYRPWLDDPNKMDPPPGLLIDRMGVPLPRRLPGVKTARVRMRQGTWLALVSYSLPTMLELGPIRMRHLLPERVVSRRWPNDEEPF